MVKKITLHTLEIELELEVTGNDRCAITLIDSKGSQLLGYSDLDYVSSHLMTMLTTLWEDMEVTPLYDLDKGWTLKWVLNMLNANQDDFRSLYITNDKARPQVIWVSGQEKYMSVSTLLPEYREEWIEKLAHLAEL